METFLKNKAGRGIPGPRVAIERISR